MESYPLMLLATLVYISVLLVVGETPLAVARRNEPFWSNPFSRFTRNNNKISQDPSAAEFRQPEFQSNNEEWDRFSEPFPADPPHRSRWAGNRKKSPPPPSRNEGQPGSIADLVDDLFPGFKYTTTRLPPKTKKAKYPAKEIHVEIDDVKDLSNILNYEGYDDIVLSITQQDSPPPGPVKSKEQQHRPSINNNSKEKQSKPFWGPPISIPTPRPESYDPRPSAKQPPESLKPEEDFSVHHTSTVGNIWELTTPGPKVAAPPSEGHKNSINDILNEKPTESFWGPLHTPASPYDKDHLIELDPFDMNFWDRATATEATYYNNPTSPETNFQSKSSLHYPLPGAHPQQTPSTPLIHAKEIDSYGNHHGAMVAYPPPVAKQEHHVVYHQPTSNYHHSAPSGFAHVDFSPIFLALIPLALVLGAAASFALASAVTSNTAIATAQQQQQQQEESSNNNNAANNNNANSILSLLASYYTSQNNQPLIIVLTTEATTTTTTMMPPPSPPAPPFRDGQDQDDGEEVETTTVAMMYGSAGGGYGGVYNGLWRNNK